MAVDIRDYFMTYTKMAITAFFHVLVAHRLGGDGSPFSPAVMAALGTLEMIILLVFTVKGKIYWCAISVVIYSGTCFLLILCHGILIWKALERNVDGAGFDVLTLALLLPLTVADALLVAGGIRRIRRASKRKVM